MRAPARVPASLIALIALLALVALASELPAQATLRVTSVNVPLPTPTVADYDAGYSRAGELTYEVAGCPTTGSCSVGLWAAAATLGDGIDITDVEWQLNGTRADRWSSLSTLPSEGNVEIVTGGMSRGTIHFRIRLAWDVNTGGESYLGHLRLAVTQR